jgi:hypothetical protein
MVLFGPIRNGVPASGSAVSSVEMGKTSVTPIAVSAFAGTARMDADIPAAGLTRWRVTGSTVGRRCLWCPAPGRPNSGSQVRAKTTAEPELLIMIIIFSKLRSWRSRLPAAWTHRLSGAVMGGVAAGRRPLTEIPPYR